MLTKTKGIVLKSFKYSDNQRIAHIFTKSSGKKSFLIYSGKSSKSRLKAKLLQPFFITEIIFYNKENANILKIKDLNLFYPFSDIPFSNFKAVTSLFLSEIVSKCLTFNMPDENLFNFLENAIKIFDAAENGKENFSILFLINMTRFLGFYPQKNFSVESAFFNLKEGIFDFQYIENQAIDKDRSLLFLQILDKSVSDFNNLDFTAEQRKILIDILLQYYSFHIEKFFPLKSYEVMKSLIVL